LFGVYVLFLSFVFFFFQAEDGIRDRNVTGVQTCALPIFAGLLGALGVLDLGPRLGGLLGLRLLARRGGLRTARGLGAAGCLATAAEFEPAGLGCALRVGDGRAGLGRAHGAPGPGRRDLGALALV